MIITPFQKIQHQFCRLSGYFLLVFFVTSCATSRFENQNLIYVDEIKYTKKGNTSYFGIFTTRPVTSYEITKSEIPPAIVVQFEDVEVMDAKFPKKLNTPTAASLETKTEMINNKRVGQILIHLKEEVEYSAKVTEYGMRVDLVSRGIPIPMAQAETATEEVPETMKEDLSELEKIQAEDIKELETGVPPEKVAQASPITTESEKEALPGEPLPEEPLKEAPPEPNDQQVKTETPKILEKINREKLTNRDRIILTHSEAIDFSKTVLDREVIIELPGVTIGENVSPIEINEPESIIKKVSAVSTQAPYPSTKVSLQLSETFHPEIKKYGNEIYIDFDKQKIPQIVGKTKKINFGGYLSSPTQMPGREISIHAENTSLSDIFKLLSETSDYNIIIGKNIQEKINVRLTRVPWDKAFVSILEAHQLGFVKKGNIIRVSTLTHLQEEKEKAASALKAKAGLDPLQVLFVPLRSRKASEMKQHLYPFLSPRGSLSIDRASNTIIIKDIPSVLERAKELVASLDHSP